MTTTSRKAPVLAAALALACLALAPAVAFAGAPAATILSSSYIGGSTSDRVWSTAIDGEGNIYLAGDTASADFPTTPGAFQQQLPANAQRNAFVVKLSPDGKRVLYSTLLGGSNWETGWGIAVNAAEDAFVTGTSCSPEFPVAGPYKEGHKSAGCDAYIVELDPTGSTALASTLIGGQTAYPNIGVSFRGGAQPSSERIDGGLSVGFGPGGLVYLAGGTNSMDFPTTAHAFQTAPHGGEDAFVAVFTPGLEALQSSTYLGGNGTSFASSIAVDPQGFAYVTGETQSLIFPTTLGAFQATAPGPGTGAFVTKLNPALTGLVYSTYVMGSTGSNGAAGNNYSAPNRLVLDGTGHAFIAGETDATDYPTTGAAFQRVMNGKTNAFVTELNADGSGLVFSTYMGGVDYNGAFGLDLGPAGDVYVAGYTSRSSSPSTDFPTANAFQPAIAGYVNAFVSRLDPSGSRLVWSSFLGGSNQDDGYAVSVHGGHVVVAGYSQSADFPTQDAFQPKNKGWTSQNWPLTGFVTVIDETPPASIPEAPAAPALLALGAVMAVAGGGRRWRLRARIRPGS